MAQPVFVAREPLDAGRSPEPNPGARLKSARESEKKSCGGGGGAARAVRGFPRLLCLWDPGVRSPGRRRFPVLPPQRSVPAESPCPKKKTEALRCGGRQLTSGALSGAGKEKGRADERSRSPPLSKGTFGLLLGDGLNRLPPRSFAAQVCPCAFLSARRDVLAPRL